MFSYLAEIVALTFLGFGSIYPLLLWLTPKALIDEGFYRFNQGMVSIVIAMSVFGAFIGPETAMIAKYWIYAVPFQGTMIMLALFYMLSSIIVLFAKIPLLTNEEFEDKGRRLSAIAKLPTFIIAVIAGSVSYTHLTLPTKA